MRKIKRSSTVGRRKSILDQINENGQVFVADLSKEFEVSEVTIRNDLEQLENKNMLLRARGGALKVDGNVSKDYNISEKNMLHYEEKVRIGKKAAQLINENETIIIDSGTTTKEIAKNLGHLNEVTVITNALNIINQLTQYNNINIIVPGGHLRKNSQSMVGPFAEKNMSNLFVDKVFIGVDGFDTKSGIYTPNIEEANFNEIMIKNSKEAIVVCDSSKFQRRSLAFICNTSNIHCVVTDSGIPNDDKKRLEDSGIKVIIA